MKKFNIEIVNAKKIEIVFDIPCYKGLLTINDFQEYFYMPFDSWSLNDYQQQWVAGIERLKDHNTSCLITSIYRLQSNPTIEWWILYKEGNTVFIQNNYFGGKILKKRSIGLPPFDIDTCYLYIHPRRTISVDGGKIAEWTIELADILAFLDKKKN